MRKQPPAGAKKSAIPDSTNMKEITAVTEILIEHFEELFGFFKFEKGMKFEDIYEVGIGSSFSAHCFFFLSSSTKHYKHINFPFSLNR